MTDEETVDLVARYTVARLSLLIEKQDRLGGGAQRGQRRKWKRQLKETKRELIAIGLAKKI